jgi:hypothetical protein
VQAHPAIRRRIARVLNWHKSLFTHESKLEIVRLVALCWSVCGYDVGFELEAEFNDVFAAISNDADPELSPTRRTFPRSCRRIILGYDKMRCFHDVRPT